VFPTKKLFRELRVVIIVEPVYMWIRGIGSGYVTIFSVDKRCAERGKLSTDFGGGVINILLNNFVTDFLVFPVSIWI
jgi:hypothetical protein